MLKGLLKDKILNSLKNVSGWKILVLDDDALKVIDSSCKMSEILGCNVTAVESLGKKRRPNVDTNAIYFISPSLASVQQMLNDFEGRSIMYATANVFCLSALTDSLFDRIKHSAAKKYLRNLVELNIDFTAPDPNYFSIDSPESFLPIFNQEQDGALVDYEIDTMAKKIVSVLVNLGEYPHIRYHSKPQAFQTNPIKSKSYLLATSIQKELDFVCRNDTSFPPNTSQKFERAVLIICDRSVEVAGVLSHDLHYQSMLSDLYGVCRNKFIDEETKKESILDENDMFWSNIRTWHIGESIEYVAEQFLKFKDENKAAQWQIGGGNSSGNSAVSIEALKDVISSFGDYAATKEAVSRHQNLCLGISRLYETRKLEGIVDIEQELLMTDPAEAPKFTKLIKRVQAVLCDSGVEYHDKIRLLFILVCCKEGISDNEREELVSSARVGNEELQAMVNMELLDVKLSVSDNRQRKSNEARNPYGRGAIVKRTKMEISPKFENDRFIPALYFVMQDQINNKLDASWFPWIKEPPPNSVLSSSTMSQANRPSTWAAGDSASSAAPPLPTRVKSNWATRKAASPTASNSINNTPAVLPDLRCNGPRVLLFVIGGVTYAETRHATLLQGQSKRECFIGGTHIWSPDSFVEALKFSRRRGGSGASFFEWQRPPPHPRPERNESGHAMKPQRSLPRHRLERNESVKSQRSNRSPTASPSSRRRDIPDERRDVPADQMARMQISARSDRGRPSIPERSRTTNSSNGGSSVPTSATSTEKKKKWFGF